MDIMRLSKEQADSYVLGILKNNIDCTDNIKIITFIDNKRVHYQLEDDMFYHEGVKKRITPLKYLEYINLLKQALSKKGYSVSFIKHFIRKGVLKYEISYQLLEKAFIRERKK